MKDFLKMIGLIAVGLFVAVIIYPFLHETGHTLIALLVGAKITRFNILPIPFVECEISAVDIKGQIFIALGGIVFPYALSMILNLKWFWGWYANFILKGISVYSVILSVIASGFYMKGITWQNEDIVKILQLFPNCKYALLIVFCTMGVYGLIQLLKEKVFSRCVEYFNKTEKITA